MILDFYYKALDFIRSRSGKVFLGCLVLTWGIFSFAGHEQSSREEKEDQASRLPRVPTADLWDEDPELAEQSPNQDPFTARKTNPGFRPLLLTEERDHQPQSANQKDSDLLQGLQDQAPAEWVPPPRLILLENHVTETEASHREPTRQREDESTHGNNGVIRPGEVVHCQLISSMASERAGEVVFARTTRPLVREGQVVIARGTLLSGRLGRVSNQGRFQFRPEWTALNTKSLHFKFHATALQKDRAINSGLPGSGDGLLGLPSIEVDPERTKKSKAGDLISRSLSAAARLGQTRINTVFGEQVPYSVRNVILEGGREILDQQPWLAEQRPPGPSRLIFAGQEFYLVVQGVK